MDIRTFLARHPVFTRDELEDALRANHSSLNAGSDTVLCDFVNQIDGIYAGDMIA